MAEEELLDARGLLCPLPVIRVQGKIRTMAPGQRLRVLATDPGALHDVPAWCRVHGHRVLEAREEGAEVVILVQVAGRGAGEEGGTS
ncbi:MAG: sulfurtransferase TusA family protein [Gammaproteobacteria bacterium]|nr:MAG: sulfurtransferase TusA family protein [Gammaproteobacteria bacterium]